MKIKRDVDKKDFKENVKSDKGLKTPLKHLLKKSTSDKRKSGGN